MAAKRYKRAYTVTVGTESTIVHVESEQEAIGRAVTKLFGSRCFWFPNHGVPGYGQVFEALRPDKYNSNPGNSSVTSMIGIDVEPIGKPSHQFILQQRADKEEADRISKEIRKESERMFRFFTDGYCGKPFSGEKGTYEYREYLKGKERQQYDQEQELAREQEMYE